MSLFITAVIGTMLIVVVVIPSMVMVMLRMWWWTHIVWRVLPWLTAVIVAMPIMM